MVTNCQLQTASRFIACSTAVKNDGYSNVMGKYSAPIRQFQLDDSKQDGDLVIQNMTPRGTIREDL